jgi:hypothetical protein
MPDMRKHKRFNLDLIDLSSKVSLVSQVEIVDISVGGVALKVDRKLNIGKECLVMLEYKGSHFNPKGIVVRSELSGIEEKADGESITIYSVGLFFKDESAGKVKDFLALIENNKETQVPAQADSFCRDVRFCIITSSEKVLNLPTQFGVKDISQKGIVIQTGHQLKIDSVVLLELSIGNCDPVNLVGKVVSCRMPQNKLPSSFDIRVEFSKLTDRSRSSLIRFIDFVKDNEHIVKWRGK